MFEFLPTNVGFSGSGNVNLLWRNNEVSFIKVSLQLCTQRKEMGIIPIPILDAFINAFTP